MNWILDISFFYCLSLSFLYLSISLQEVAMFHKDFLLKLENLEEMFPRYYMHSDLFNSV